MGNLLKTGCVINITEAHTVYAKVYDNPRARTGKGRVSAVRASGDYKYLQGAYVVTKTEMTGGGTGNGPHDVYPDGHKVTCQRLDNDNEVISFYQTGCFTAMIEDIKPVAYAHLQWVVVAGKIDGKLV